MNRPNEKEPTVQRVDLLKRLGEATTLVEMFLATDFSGEERHVRRLELVASYEETGVAPSLPEPGIS